MLIKLVLEHSCSNAPEKAILYGGRGDVEPVKNKVGERRLPTQTFNNSCTYKCVHCVV